MSEPKSSQAEKARERICNMLGKPQGEALIADTMRSAGLETIETPDERYRFGLELVKKPGLIEAIGRAIMVNALLHGAKPG